MEELSRAGEDEGKTAAWHMRRVVLAAQAWARTRKYHPAAGAKVDEYLQALVDLVRDGKQKLGIVRGTDDFLRVAEELATIAPFF